MRVLPQISVTTTETCYSLVGSKIVIVKTGSYSVYVHISHRQNAKDGDYYEIPANTTYKFTSEKGKLFWSIYCYNASGSGTLNVAETNDDLELIS